MKYEFTLTLRPNLYTLNAKEQFNLTKDILLNIFYPDNMPAYNVSCIAELTKEHNVHYHCLIELQTIIDKDKLLNKFRRYNKMFGKKTCTQVQYEDSYRAYIIKDLDNTRKIIGDPVVLDDYNVVKTIFG